jgi:hypothetical protein
MITVDADNFYSATYMIKVHTYNSNRVGSPTGRDISKTHGSNHVFR